MKLKRILFEFEKGIVELTALSDGSGEFYYKVFGKGNRRLGSGRLTGRQNGNKTTAARVLREALSEDIA